MSRIGKLPIDIPAGVTVDVKGCTVTVQGPKGKLEQEVKPVIGIAVEGSTILLKRKSESKQAKAYHGLYRNLVRNMVVGVSNGFSKVLLINGVGYRAEMQGDTLVLNLGFSNPINYGVEPGLKIACEGNNRIVVSGIDKQRVGQVSAEIRSLRPPEPYKGKGVKYENEVIRRKIGKAGIK